MNYKQFEKNLISLNASHRKIVVNVLRKMKHKTPVSVNEFIYHKIRKRKKQLGMTWSDILKIINNQHNNSVQDDTFKTYIRRKSINGDLLPYILNALGINANIDSVKNAIKTLESMPRFKYMIDDDREIRMLYDTLIKYDKLTIANLTHELHMLETHPEKYAYIEPCDKPFFHIKAKRIRTVQDFLKP